MEALVHALVIGGSARLHQIFAIQPVLMREASNKGGRNTVWLRGRKRSCVSESSRESEIVLVDPVADQELCVRVCDAVGANRLVDLLGAHAGDVQRIGHVDIPLDLLGLILVDAAKPTSTVASIGSED